MTKRIWSYVKKHPAFTLVEMMMVIALLGAISAMVVPFLNDARLSSDLYNAAELTVQGLGRAKLLSLSGEGDAVSWGFHAPTGTLYKGTSYVTRDVSADEFYTLPTNVAVSGLLDVPFTGGNPGAIGTIVLTSIGGRSLSVRIEISEEGIVANKNDQFMICHCPPGQPGSACRSLAIPQSAWPAHRKHCASTGECDFIGPCTVTVAAASSAGGGSYLLSGPQAVAIDVASRRLFVADTGNNRVLVYALSPTNQLLDEIPDAVLGQADFAGTAAATTQAGMNAPSALAFDAVRRYLFIADTGNNRVLVYDVAAIADGENAINVLGQANFTTSTPATTQTGLRSPAGIAYDEFFGLKFLYVADTGNNRVLIFTVPSPIANGAAASKLMGQGYGSSNYTTSAPGTGEHNMNGPRGLGVDAARDYLFVADTNNNRVLVYNIANSLETFVLGQTNFTSSTAATTQAGMRSPMGVAYAAGGSRAFVSDTGNHRVLVFNAATITNGDNAVNVLGQSNFTASGPSSTAAGMQQPMGPAHDGIGWFFLADTGNNRVTFFGMNFLLNGVDAAAVLDGL